ncbi:hypothetical protein Q9966_014944 [Columba livia]|nr:hypothetical protein Q9966_014944 [Columba livia]
MTEPPGDNEPAGPPEPPPRGRARQQGTGRGGGDTGGEGTLHPAPGLPAALGCRCPNQGGGSSPELPQLRPPQDPRGGAARGGTPGVSPSPGGVPVTRGSLRQMQRLKRSLSLRTLLRSKSVENLFPRGGAGPRDPTSSPPPAATRLPALRVQEALSVRAVPAAHRGELAAGPAVQGVQGRGAPLVLRGDLAPAMSRQDGYRFPPQSQLATAAAGAGGLRSG